MAAATRFLSSIKSIPARSASFAGFAGPVGLFGADSTRNGAPSIAMRAFEKHALRSGADFYSDIEWHTDVSKPLERPPLSSLFLPTLNCGVYAPDKEETKATVDDVMRSTSAYLTDKGIIPMCVGGGAELVVPMVEGIKQVTGEDFFVFHMGANTLMDSEDAPLTQLLRRGLCRNFFALANRGVSAHARKVRREHQVRYFDNNALYHKGIFTIKDIRNQYPALLLLDVGVLDPAFAPGVLAPEPGGLTLRDALHLMSVLRGVRVMGVLIVGFEPEYDVFRGKKPDALPEDALTALTVSKLMKECINKSYTMSVKTSAEGYEMVAEYQSQGKIPESYPD